MILTVAPGSGDHYFVDEDGDVYTARRFDVVLNSDDRRLKPERPSAVLAGRPPARDTQGGCHPRELATFWIRTGQSDAGRVFEGDEQMEDAYERIRRARAARELYVTRVEAALGTLDDAELLADEARREYLATLDGVERDRRDA